MTKTLITSDPTAAPPGLEWDIDNTEVPANGKEVTKVATEAERVALAQALRILSCDQLDAKYRVRRLAGDAYGVRGKVTADVVQACVITLAPVFETLSIPFAVEFHPLDAANAAAEGAVDLDDDVEIEAFDGKTLAIGRVIFEELTAALNPYPRRPGAEYAAAATTESTAADAKANPFAALAKLKIVKEAPKA
jgi:uncharacterized metal-binding protein YceD (DUF177 family)